MSPSPFDTLLQQVKNKLSSTASTIFNATPVGQAYNSVQTAVPKIQQGITNYATRNPNAAGAMLRAEPAYNTMQSGIDKALQFRFQAPTQNIQNPYLKTAADVGSSILLAPLNAPISALQGAYKFPQSKTPQEAIGNAAQIVNAAMSDPRAFINTAGKVIDQPRFLTAGQKLLSSVKSGTSTGAQIGAFGGLMSGLEQAKMIQDPAEYTKNVLSQAGIGLVAGGTLGGITGAIGSIGKSTGEKIQGQARTEAKQMTKTILSGDPKGRPKWTKGLTEKQIEEKLYKYRLDQIKQSGAIDFSAEVGVKPSTGGEIGGNKTYQIAEPTGMRTVQGEPVKIADGLETFLRAGDNGHGFAVSEVSTGRLIAVGETKASAVAKAKSTINDVGLEKTLEYIKKYQPSSGDIPKKTFEPPQGSMGFAGKAQFKQPIKVPEQPRGFVKTLQQSPKTMKQVKERLQGTFTPITNKETLKEAQKVVSSNFEASRQRVLNEPLTAETSAMGQDLIRRYQNAKQWDSAVEIAESIAKKATKQGQAIQALSMWSRLTPEGALKYAQRLIQRAKQVNGVDYVLSSDKARKITEIAKSIQKMEGQERILRTADLMAEFSTVVPSSLASKISTIQTMAQLLNPKTAIRNLGGNLGFQGIENVSRAVATPIDIATSMVTGKRSTVLPSLSVQAQGLARGWREGVRDALRGIDTSSSSTQYDLPKSTFSGKVGKGFEKLLNLELRAPDRAFYTSAVEESLNNQMRAAGVKVPTDAMKEIAHADGLYRTFQDENIATRIFTGIKRGLNAGKEFGLGDLVLKYPKTPASLLMRGIDYSPMGFVKTVYEMAKPLIGKEFNQREFVNSFSRALVGTGGLMTTGAILYNAGIITGKQEKDYDISATQKEMGLGGYKVNVSALKRFVLSGMDTEAAKRQEGDTLINYDWIQPMAIGVSMGANIAENNGKVKDGSMLSSILSSVAGGAETLAEQPLIQGVQKLAKGQGIVQALTETIKGTPASFVPQIASQVNQFMDNRSRITQSPDFMTEMGNLVKAKIPGLAQTLPGKFTVWGEPMERYQGDSNTLFNVFFNPAFVTKLKTTPEGQEVIDIFEQSGEKTQAPRVVENKIKINGQDKELTGEEISTYQQYIGTKTKDIFNQLVQEPTFKQLGNEEKANAMANILSDINSAAKIELFGNEPKNVPKKVQSILSGSQVGYMPKVESDGSVKMIDTSFQPTKPTLTGLAELDKKAISKYNSEITQKVNDVYDLFLAGKLSANDANTQIARLKGTTIKSGKKTPKPTFKTRRLPKLKALKVKKAKKIKVPKIKPIKFLKAK